MRLYFFRTVVLLSLFLWVQAAAAQTETVYGIKNETVEITFLSAYEPYVSQDASYGAITLVESPQFNYTLTYTPQEDFVGQDEFLLVHFPFGYNVRFTDYRIIIQEADVRARHDEAITASGSPVRIPVLENDYANTGALSLAGVPVVNGGSATVDGQGVIFTPNPGFVGLTDLNYVTCTDGGVCDLGTVTINVTPGSGGTTSDTVRVFTKRGQGQYLFAGANALPVNNPEHGVTVDSSGVMAYLPAPGFVGDETLIYTEPANDHQTVFEITVLDLDENAFAEEDRAYTPVGAPVTLNVLHNDLYTVFGDCVTWGTPRHGSLAPTGARGQVTYTPPPGWTGVDRFTYTSQPPGCPGTTEEATVYIFVSDFAPEPGIRTLNLPAGSAVPISYDVPNGRATWRLATNPRHGTVEENADGKLVYFANPGAAGQTDRFRVRYCLNPSEQGTCASAFSVPVAITIEPAGGGNGDCAAEDCVWPGDTNRDGVVDVGDLLNIGLATGKSGPARPSADPAEWSGQYAEDWGESLNGVDLKHIDANGDRVISALDTAVVLANLGRAHRLHPEAQTFTTFELSLLGPTEAEPGDLITLDIVTGTAGTIVEDVYGFRFPFPYNPTGVEEHSVGVHFDEKSWLSYDSPILGMVSDDPDTGVLSTAVTRTSRHPISGYGKIGTLSATIVEDVYGFFTDPNATPGDSVHVGLTFGGSTGMATNALGGTGTVRIQPKTILINATAPEDLSATTPAAAAEFLQTHLKTFPNPTRDVLTVHLNGQQRFHTLQLTDITGRQIFRQTGLNTNHASVNVADQPRGLYTLTLITEAGAVTRRIQVQ